MMSETAASPELPLPPPLPSTSPQPSPPQPQAPVRTFTPRPPPTMPHIDAHQVLWMVVGAVFVNFALRTEVASLSSALAALVIAVPVLGPHVRSNKMAMSFAVAGVVFALWLPIRASLWLTGLNALAVTGCFLAAAITVQPLRLRFDTTTITTIFSRFFQGRFFVRLFRSATIPYASVRSKQVVPVLRGLAIAALPVTILAALLASADAVFAQSFSNGINLTSSFNHVLLTMFALVGIAGLLAMAAEAERESFKEYRPLGATEALVLLLSIGGLYGAFAIVQLFSALGKADELLVEQGLTYAEYARSGFFQLLWVAGLTIGLLLTIRTFVADGSSKVTNAVRLAGAGVSLLTILIVIVAIVRLGLYTDEFGQTALRWFCTAFAWMLGALFVALAIGHHRRAEHLLPVAVLMILATTLFAVNVLNPEARIAEHNLARSDAAEQLDARYLSNLSADAWPALLAKDDLVESRLESNNYDIACADAAEEPGYGVLGFNLARWRLDCG